jgi:hypothetical protein
VPGALLFPQLDSVWCLMSECRYYCDGGSATPTQHACGGVDKYCPRGSGAPIIALAGEFTMGPTNATRNATAPCPSGFYCLGGVKLPCPAGRFGCADRLGSEECNGPCTAGN